MLTHDTIAKFTWSFGCKFFLETKYGNYVWSDPEYGGDNSIVLFHGNYEMWIAKLKIPYGRDKGVHTIGGYCGEGVKLP